MSLLEGGGKLGPLHLYQAAGLTHPERKNRTSSVQKEGGRQKEGGKEKLQKFAHVEAGLGKQKKGGKNEDFRERGLHRTERRERKRNCGETP